MAQNGGPSRPKSPTPSHAESSTSATRHLVDEPESIKSTHSSSNLRTQVPEPSGVDHQESEEIKHHLTSRRKSSFIPDIFGHKGKGKQTEANNDSNEDLADNVIQEDAAWYEDLDQDDFLINSKDLDFEDYKSKIPELIKLLKSGEDWTEWDGLDLNEQLRKGFAWDVMFENQRGIHFLGKGYFSSQSLLPTDPSQYTVPSRPLNAASTLPVLTTSQNPTDHTLDSQRKKGKNRPTKMSRNPDTTPKFYRSPNTTDKPAQEGEIYQHHINLSANHRNIDTAYSLQTYQCPGPQWQWITPWMINMKLGTDEGGWRYNAWFKKKGWKNHAGPAGWWGWVRRREWVRLRMVGGFKGVDEQAQEVEEEKVKEKTATENKKNEEGEERQSERELKDLLRGTSPEEDAKRVEHILSQLPLDREKKEWWSKQLESIGEDVERHLQAILNDEQAVSNALNHATRCLPDFAVRHS